jgi:hypothetical protein
LQVAFPSAGFKVTEVTFALLGPSQTSPMVFVILNGRQGQVAVSKWPQAIQRKDI